MIPTPDLSHLTSQDFDRIYEPAEDTFLLLDCLEEDASQLQDLQPRVCLEIGSGSGCVTTLLAKIIGAHNAIYFTTDINPYACKATRETAVRNAIHTIEPVRTSLTEALLPRLAGQVDVLCFNPPYAVTPPEEVGSVGIEAAWAGGIDGRQVIDAMLPYVEKLLSPKGVFYLLLINENKPTEVAEILRANYGLQAEIVMQRRAGREKQFILKVQKSS
ncbi:S-adenosyl-L-methionine-dependent methyltransferase [Radiomyces spectabilis]|uniref:S-adenosyl-L-methionine-dependent methyltransferase n=1 Tax=Radiomyces spectabilis TaxID=64574 RepID=UPI00221F84D6|nr:S-adenosyl-L-methionine-dependent methyltransferase [Radiomyces spectabilis]KAI8393373.1 S-adenosyl-L-methionine-dependent methyltransferase [Radiomyces spectabilis]